jgi:predicted DNA-binding transcriptional regulator AlpA
VIEISKPSGNPLEEGRFLHQGGAHLSPNYFPLLAAGMNRETIRRKAQIESADIAMLNVKELEAFLKIDQKTIYRYVSLGLIPYVRIQSNIRFVRHQIVAWIEEQNYTPDGRSFSERTNR